MAEQSFAIIGWSLNDLSGLGSQVFKQALMDSCSIQRVKKQTNKKGLLVYLCDKDNRDE